VECHQRAALYLIWPGELELSKEEAANPAEN